MNPTIEQIGQQRANLLTEAGDLETRAMQLRTDATKLEGVILYLHQQAAEPAKSTDATQSPTTTTSCPKKNPQK